MPDKLEIRVKAVPDTTGFADDIKQKIKEPQINVVPILKVDSPAVKNSIKTLRTNIQNQLAFTVSPSFDFSKFRSEVAAIRSELSQNWKPVEINTDTSGGIGNAKNSVEKVSSLFASLRKEQASLSKQLIDLSKVDTTKNAAKHAAILQQIENQYDKVLILADKLASSDTKSMSVQDVQNIIDVQGVQDAVLALDGIQPPLEQAKSLVGAVGANQDKVNVAIATTTDKFNAMSGAAKLAAKATQDAAISSEQLGTNDEQISNIKTIAETFGVAKTEVNSLVDAQNRLRSANGTEQQKAAQAAYNEALRETNRLLKQTLTTEKIDTLGIQVQNLNSLGQEAGVAQASIDSMNRAFEQLKTLNGTEVQTQAMKALRDSMALVKQDLQDVAGNERLNSSLGKIKNQLAQIGVEWSAIKSDGGLSAQYQKLVNQANNTTSAAGLKKLNAEVAIFKSQVIAAGKNTRSWLDSVSAGAKKLTSWISVTAVLMSGIRLMKDMVSEVRNLDDAMVELRKVTDETENSYNRFFNNAIGRAKQFGTSVSDVITATADFARLGYGVDEASTLADAALVYKNVGDGLTDITEASQSIISTMKAFGLEVSDAMGVVDKFNEVGKFCRAA